MLNCSTGRIQKIRWRFLELAQRYVMDLDVQHILCYEQSFNVLFHYLALWIIITIIITVVIYRLLFEWLFTSVYLK